jgi:hypothetical protein
MYKTYKGYIINRSIMKFITRILKTFVKDDKKILGRWNIEYCDVKVNNKIDLSNEDHCGPCGEYILHKSALDNKDVKPPILGTMDPIVRK